MLSWAVLSVDDFNKNNLLKYAEQYLNDAPRIEIEYVVRHLISESDTEDESIIRLLPFLGMDKLNATASKDDDENFQYDITAIIKAVCTLDSKVLGEYKNAVAGLDNMYMLAHGDSDCRQQSLANLFSDKKESEKEDAGEVANTNEKETPKEKSDKQAGKEHLAKFLDVTRSDMLFADKVILVEGIAEKLLLPMFMEKCGCAYEDEHISIVEIGGKHFEHFVELFNGNNVHKKVLCITDRDFSWIKEDGGVKLLSDFETYDESVTPHIKKLQERFPISNFHIVTQTMGGRTFEDELILANMAADAADFVVAAKLMSLVANDTVSKLLKDHSLNFADWDANRPTAANSIVSVHLDVFKAAISRDSEHEEQYKQLFFAELFLYYAKNHKGDVALSILTDDTITKDIIVPQYIKEGLEWLLK